MLNIEYNRTKVLSRNLLTEVLSHNRRAEVLARNRRLEEISSGFFLIQEAWRVKE